MTLLSIGLPTTPPINTGFSYQLRTTRVQIIFSSCNINGFSLIKMQTPRTWKCTYFVALLNTKPTHRPKSMQVSSQTSLAFGRSNFAMQAKILFLSPWCASEFPLKIHEVIISEGLLCSDCITQPPVVMEKVIPTSLLLTGFIVLYSNYKTKMTYEYFLLN